MEPLTRLGMVHGDPVNCPSGGIDRVLATRSNPLVAWLIAFASLVCYFSDPLIEKLEDEAKRRQQAGKDIPPEEPQP